MPQAQITFDRFHIQKVVNEGVDQVRREESREVDGLKTTRYLWLEEPGRPHESTEGQRSRP